MTEFRCTKCGKLLFKTITKTENGMDFDREVCLTKCSYSPDKITSIEIKCLRCHTLNEIIV